MLSHSPVVHFVAVLPPLTFPLFAHHALHRGDVSGVDAQVIFLAVEVWLLWIQPWNALAILNSPTGK
jgi:hypothetical protein